MNGGGGISSLRKIGGEKIRVSLLFHENQTFVARIFVQNLDQLVALFELSHLARRKGREKGVVEGRVEAYT